MDVATDTSVTRDGEDRTVPVDAVLLNRNAGYLIGSDRKRESCFKRNECFF